MREYEIMLILPADADDKVIGGALDRIAQVLSRHQGALSHVDRWGRRRFAYPIDKVTDGFYVVAEFTSEPESVKELDRVLSLADEVIRFKVLVLPEKRKRSAAPAGETAAGAAAPRGTETRGTQTAGTRRQGREGGGFARPTGVPEREQAPAGGRADRAEVASGPAPGSA